MIQPSLLSDEVMEHHPGPTVSGQQEYRHVQQVKLVERMHDSVADWRPPELPNLSQFDEIFLDLETTGLRWWVDDRLIGAGLRTPDGITRYLPIRHKVGPNIDEATFFRWARRELVSKRIVNIRTKFDLHMLRMDGVDLEAQGCTFGDVAHYAALLDDHRRTFNQADLAKTYLGDEVVGKLTQWSKDTHPVKCFDLDPSKFADYPVGLVAARAESDVSIVFQLQQTMWPMLTEQDLHRVRILEDAIIPVVVEMESNGAPIDVELLNTWCQQSEKDVEDALWDIHKATGVLMETATKRDDILRLFQSLRIQIPLDAETGKPTIADDALATIDHPVIFTLRRAIALASLRSKFLLKYQRSVARDGILRYELHQLPYQDDAEGRGGAVSGRFSSAAMTYFDETGKQCSEGGNIQQVFGVKSQLDPKRAFNPTQDYIVRKLFKPTNGSWFAADMRQIEYRRFVHYSGSEKLLQSYQDDPLIDYHALVHRMVLDHTGRDFERVQIKCINFASIYGAGLLKIALMVGEISEQVYHELRGMMNRSDARRVHTDPRVAKTKSLYDTYHQMFPEVKRLLQLASQTAETRGYVKTILGRRARFNPGDRMYSALNRVIQGTAADDHKSALIAVHSERYRLGFVPRMTVHDELCGDLTDLSMLPEMARLLNEPRLESRVPILWSSSCGVNWADSK